MGIWALPWCVLVMEHREIDANSRSRGWSSGWLVSMGSLAYRSMVQCMVGADLVMADEERSGPSGNAKAQWVI